MDRNFLRGQRCRVNIGNRFKVNEAGAGEKTFDHLRITKSLEGASFFLYDKGATTAILLCTKNETAKLITETIDGNAAIGANLIADRVTSAINAIAFNNPVLFLVPERQYSRLCL